MSIDTRVKYLIDFQEEADILSEYLSNYTGIVRAFGEVNEMCNLSVQDNVLRVLSGVDDLFVKEPLLVLESWIPSDVLKSAVVMSKILAKEKLDSSLPKQTVKVRGGVSDYSNVVWLSNTKGVVY